MGGPSGACDRTLGSEPRPIKPRMQVSAHVLLATEEMRDARHIGNQTLRAVAGHHRCVASCPPSQRRQGCGLAREIGRAGADIRADGSGIGQGHSPAQSAGESRLVHAMQMIGVARPKGQGEGSLNRAPSEAHIARQPRKPYGKQPTRHSSLSPSRH